MSEEPNRLSSEQKRRLLHVKRLISNNNLSEVRKTFQSEQDLLSSLKDRKVFNGDEPSPVHYAAQYESPDILKALLDEFGFIVDSMVETEKGTAWSPLNACREIECSRILLDRGAKVGKLRTWADGSEYTALHRAARYGAVDLVKLLLERGANPERKGKHVKDGLDGTPSDWAIHGDHTETANLIQAKSAKLATDMYPFRRPFIALFDLEGEGLLQKDIALIMEFFPNVKLYKPEDPDKLQEYIKKVKAEIKKATDCDGLLLFTLGEYKQLDKTLRGMKVEFPLEGELGSLHQKNSMAPDLYIR